MRVRRPSLALTTEASCCTVSAWAFSSAAATLTWRAMRGFWRTSPCPPESPAAPSPQGDAASGLAKPVPRRPLAWAAPVFTGAGASTNNNVTVITHPLVQHKLTLMRRKDASTNSFRRLLGELSTLMAYEVTRDMPLQDIEI